MPLLERFAGHKLLAGLFVFLTASAIYLYTFPQTNILYAGVVLLHALGGIIATLLLVINLLRLFREASLLERLGYLLMLVAAVIGCVLLYTGTSRPEWNKLCTHILVSFVAVAILFAERMGRRGWLGSGLARGLARVALCLLVLGVLGYAARYQREARWQSRMRIANPEISPATMDNEGDGPQGPFFPSSAQVYGGEKIPSKFFM